MKLQFLIYAFTATVLAAPTEHYSSVIHEKRYVRPGLKRGARIDGTSFTSFRIALKQRNLEKGKMLLDRLPDQYRMAFLFSDRVFGIML
jgi:hypothetical protein